MHVKVWLIDLIVACVKASFWQPFNLFVLFLDLENVKHYVLVNVY